MIFHGTPGVVHCASEALGPMSLLWGLPRSVDLHHALILSVMNKFACDTFMLKEYSAILTTSFCGMNHKIKGINKTAYTCTSKISCDFNLMYASYALSYALALLHKLMC